MPTFPKETAIDALCMSAMGCPLNMRPLSMMGIETDAQGSQYYPFINNFQDFHQ